MTDNTEMNNELNNDSLDQRGTVIDIRYNRKGKHSFMRGIR